MSMLPTNEGVIRARDTEMKGAGREELNGDFSKPGGGGVPSQTGQKIPAIKTVGSRTRGTH
jgi:hypothetical protein